MTKKKLLAALLAVCMVLSILPAGIIPAYAEGEPEALSVGENIVMSDKTYTFTPDKNEIYWFCSFSAGDPCIVIDFNDGQVFEFDDIDTVGDTVDRDFCDYLQLSQGVTYNISFKEYSSDDPVSFVLTITPSSGFEIINLGGAGGYVSAQPYAAPDTRAYFKAIPNAGVIETRNIEIYYEIVGDEETERVDVAYESEGNNIYSFVMPEEYVYLSVDFEFDMSNAVEAFAGENSISINSSDESALYSFTPEETNIYIFSSLTGEDPEITLYDEYGNELGWNDDSNGSYEFRLAKRLAAYTTYYISVQSAASGGVSGTMTIETGDLCSSGHGLVLSGEIGLIFYFDTSPYFVTDNAYVEFKTGRFGTQKADLIDDGTFTYATCCIPSYRMADEITPVVHYYKNGEEMTAELEPYSVEDYIDYVTENEERFDLETIDMSRALADYGYYAQNYLSELHGYSIGDDGKYAAMSTHFNDEYDYDYYRDELSWIDSYEVTLDDSMVEKASFSLNLEATTSMYFYLTVKEGVTLSSVKAVSDESVYDTGDMDIALYSDNVYRVKVSNIRAWELGTLRRIGVYDESGHQVAYFELYPLTYAYLAMSNDSIDPAFADALCALYNYCLISESIAFADPDEPDDPDDPDEPIDPDEPDDPDDPDEP